jgi:hypothetical protein
VAGKPGGATGRDALLAAVRKQVEYYFSMENCAPPARAR